MNRWATPSQTVGPYFEVGLALLMNGDLAGPDVPGKHITLEGRVLDGNRDPIPDAVVEIWQANRHGKYCHPDDWQTKPLDPKFRGYGRVGTDENGGFRFRTIKPGGVPGPDGSTQAPHLEVSIFMRGLLARLTTRVYFPDDPANVNDPILNLVEPARRHTLIAHNSEEGVLRWDVLIQGDDETVFLNV